MEEARKTLRVTPEEWALGPVPTRVGIDFETFYTSKYSVSEMGTWAYCRDARFDAWAVSVSDGVWTCVCHPTEFPWASIEGLEWVSHNREFDQGVYGRVKSDGKTEYGKGPRVWHCSAALCAYLQLPRDLAGAALAVFGVELSKAVRTELKGKRGSVGQKDLFGEDREADYAATDAEMSLALWNELNIHWPTHERRLFDLTCSMGRHGVAMDWEYVAANLAELTTTVAEIGASLPWKPALSIKKFEEACAALGVTPPPSTAATDAGFMEWIDENQRSLAATWVRHMQRIRSANRTAKVLESMGTRRMRDVRDQLSVGSEQRSGVPPSPLAMPGRSPVVDRMAFDLKYFGASTGRWSGGGGLNMQNFNRKPSEGVDLRRCIVAPPGKLLVVADYSQIESRVLLFLAGDAASLEMFRANPDADAYEIHARATMGFSQKESLKDYCDRTGSNIRQLAKARVLGLGFQCGVKGFVDAAKAMAGLDISEDESVKIVREFRDSNFKIVELWDRLHNACTQSDGGDYFLPLPCTQVNPELKRFLIYRDVRKTRRVRRNSDDWFDLECIVDGERITVYGGLLTENWTQATARDVLASAWLRCVDEGFTPVMSVHDELVFEVDEATAETERARIVEIMERPMLWATGLPLRVDGKLMRVYGK